MPGIYGFVKSSFVESNLTDLGLILRGRHAHLIKDDDYCSVDIAASRIHMGNVGMKKSPFVDKNVVIWVDGEAFNEVELASFFGFLGTTLEEGLSESYLGNVLDDYLNKLDGYFSAVLYDIKQKKVLLLSDRYGMRMLYFYFKDGHFAWASEPKVFLGLKEMDKSLNIRSLTCFVDLGYLVGDMTFFQNVHLTRPASILEFSITDKTYSQNFYWKWSEIKPRKLSFDDAVDELGRVFLEAVKRRYSVDNKIGISLSGGLDSRAIFAAVNSLYPKSTGFTFTFGQEGCKDIDIARQVVDFSNWRHKVYLLSTSNWFAPRIKKIWDSDGMFNMIDMHGSEFLLSISKHIAVNLNGYAGDAVCGGGFLNQFENDVRINMETAKKQFGKYQDCAYWESDFYDIEHAEPALYMSRIRRLTNMGSVNSLSHLEHRKPFFDNQLIEFVFSIPDYYRAENKLYAAMLLKFFPKFFSSIPWQNTGLVVGSKLKLRHRVVRRIKRELVKLGLSQNRNDYTNYPDWIRSDDSIAIITEILTRTPSYLKTYLGIDAKKQYLEPHMKKERNYSDEILKSVTLEVYLKEIETIDSLQ